MLTYSDDPGKEVIQKVTMSIICGIQVPGIAWHSIIEPVMKKSKISFISYELRKNVFFEIKVNNL